ncbi:unannotated protein [freshwater metagenome]|uniref:Unannotated protein n=1 Tax=freshwater metagenome TaxID=449393 RepID=A0A6J6L7M3_9ZZZZ
MANAAKKLYFVDFETLARAAPIAQAPPTQFVLNLFCRDIKPGRQTLNDDHESLSVAFACGEVTQHAYRLPLANSRPWPI